MSYKLFEVMDIYNIIRRWHAGYKIRQISKTLQIDRKTVRTYIQLADKAGLVKEQPLPEKAALFERLMPLIPTNARPQPARNALEPYKDEIIALINKSSDPLKPKTAYEVICARHPLGASYSSFKRFVRHYRIAGSKSRSTCRFETAAGEQLQIDYGYMGLLYDPMTKKAHRVHAFIATLSCSRHKYVEFVTRQDQRSFVAAHIRMFEFFGGVPKCVVIDNLKDGVLKPDLYDPTLNRAYQELADHYGFFIDPARVRHPKDKGQVERSVPVVREQFRKFKALHPQLELATANKLAHDWSVLDYGMKPHGTTGLKPFEIYQEIEKPALLPLPTLPFELPRWKEATVHVDQFIQFEKKFYGVPEEYIGKTVWVRGTDNVVHIFYKYQLIKQYPRARQTRMFDPQDFPPNVQVMLGEQAVQNLITRAEIIGPNFKQLIVEVLSPHAKLNYRRALGLLHFHGKFPLPLLEAAAAIAVAHKIYYPPQFKRVLEKLQAPEDPIPISGETLELLRSAEYFVH
jgi:transposase